MDGEPSNIVPNVNLNDAETFREFSQHRFIRDKLPSGTRHVQIKAYIDKKSEKYALCTCLNSKGRPLVICVGKETISYTDVFVEKTCIVMNVAKLEYIFYSSMTK